jgi:GTP-binding protein
MARQNAQSGAEDGELSAAALETGRLLFAGPIEFERSAPAMADLPEADRVEIAFAGRSNVGKSSLLNTLTGRKALARASAEPGRTRELVSFLVGERLRLMDMPGYGFARAPKTEIARWTGLVRDYLRGRPTLKRVFLLIDARHGVKPNDAEVMDLLDASAMLYQAVLTKTDKLSAGEAATVLAATKATLAKRPAAHPVVLSASSVTNAGVEALRAEIAALL